MLSQHSNHAQHVLSNLNQQRAVGQFCDTLLNVGGGGVYLAHRNILACFSELFKESKTPMIPCTEVCLQECPNDGLELLLNFFYTGELMLDSVNLDKVQRAASSLHVPQAVALCQQFTESSSETVTLKRKRGRPRKIVPDITFHTTEEISNAMQKYKPGFDDVTTTVVATNITSTTTTRSGRKVRGPRRLVGESPNSDFTPLEKGSQSTEHPPTDNECQDSTGETEVDLQRDLSDNSISLVTEDDADDVVEACSDEDYISVEPGSVPPSTPRVRSKADKKGKDDAIKDEAKTDSVRCPTCHKTFRSKYYLKVHNRRHTGEKPFVCLKCCKSYFRKENLLEHETRNCARVHTYTCPTCNMQFNKKGELHLHITSHTGDMPNKCSSCCDQFMHKKELSLHMIKTHGFPKPHPCTECTKAFLTRTELRVHEAAKHRGEKPFVCEECGHRASSRNGLQMHIKAIHRSYLTPVRDEESESQRRARSRQARQSRRSTQGVTLTDLQEAEKTIGRSRPVRSRDEEKEEKEKQDKEKRQEERKENEAKEEDYRSRFRSFEETYQRYRPSSSSISTSPLSAPSSSTSSSSTSTTTSSSSLNRPNSLSGITSAYSRSSRDTDKETERQEDEKELGDRSQPRSIRDRRRPREKRRSTGVSFWTQDSDENDRDHLSDSEDGSTKGEPQSDRLSRNESNSPSEPSNVLGSSVYGEGRRPYLSRLERDDATDYKKLYEQILAENEKLKAQLRDTDLELTGLKLQLEKATQRQEHFADRSQLEMEKRERRALERKISEMEEELKTLPDLKADNQRLKDENGALIRVISKLSK